MILDILEPYVRDDGQPGLISLNSKGEYSDLSLNDCYDKYTYEENEIKILDNAIRNYVWRRPGKMNPLYKDDSRSRLEEVECDIVSYLKRHVWIKDPRYYDLLACWVISSYFRDEYRFLPLLIIDGTTVAGKSTLQETLAAISYHGFVTSNYSSAAVTRLIKHWRISVFLDESLDNIGGDRGVDLGNLIKSVTSPEQPYVRAVPKTRDQVEIIRTYTNMALSVKGAEIAEDIVNRGIRIQMLTKPGEIELDDIGDAEEDLKDNPDGPESIRTRLYEIMLHERIPNDTYGVKDQTKLHLGTWSKAMKDWLKTQDERSGRWKYAEVLDIKNAPKINNRLKNIATTLLPIAMECKCAKDVMELIIEEEKNHKESSERSFEATVFQALVDCILGEDEESTGGPIDGVWDRASFREIVRHITTKRVAARVNASMHEVGELDKYTTISTLRVTYTLKSLGIPYLMGRGSGGRASTINPTATGFIELFLRELDMYDPESVEYFVRLK